MGNFLNWMQQMKMKAAGERFTSYGGVLFNEQGQVLLREVKNHYKGYVWTFPKGRQEGGSPEQTALREVEEEAGYKAEIIGKVPGTFPGKESDTEYFIMRPIGTQKGFDWETERTEWVDAAAAPAYISQTQHPTGRDRDLAVLKAAVAEYQKISGEQK
jgi:8-oxo-dGTP diphosphatase